MNTAVLILCQNPGKEVLEEYHKIAEAVRGFAVPYLLLHSQGSSSMKSVNGAHCYPFTNQSLTNLPFPMFQNSVVPGSTHFPLLQFYRDNPEYHFYWIIEYDVKFSGDWRVFFQAFDGSHAAFLTSHIRPYAEEPQWCWWKLSHPKKRIALADRLRSFNPIYRISREAVSRLYEAHTDGWLGHFEVLMPTLLFHGGFPLEDFGGSGRFVAAENRERFYRDSPSNKDGYLHQGTMRFCPTFKEVGAETEKLYHPVKRDFKLNLLRTGHLFRSKFLWGKGYRECV
jgi:hypothetical protein